MSSTALFKLAAFSLILGGILAASGHLLAPLEPADPGALVNYTLLSQPSHLLIFFGAIFVMVGLVGILLRQRTRAGLPGVLAVCSLFFGLLLSEVIGSVLEFSILPLLVRSFPYATIPLVHACYEGTPLALMQKFGMLLYLGGASLLAVVTLRARVLSWWAVLPLSVSSVTGFVSLIPSLTHFASPLFAICFYISAIALGAALWSSLRLRVTFREIATAVTSVERAHSSMN